MNAEEKELRAFLKTGLDDRHPRPLDTGAHRKIAAGRALFALAAVTALAATAYGGFALSQFATPAPDAPAASERAADSEEGTAGEPRPTTPKVEVATGRQRGELWSVYAYRAIAEVPDEGAAAGDKEALCLSMDFGPERAPEATCAVGLQEPFEQGDAFYAVATAAPEWTRGFFGTVAKNVDRVELRLEDGTSYPAAIHNGGAELRAPFNFFVGFVPEWEDVTIVALDRTGASAETQVWEAPPVLRVTKAGDGDGRVTGTRTEEITCSGCQPHRWIDCGSDCTALINDASVTLEAHPEDGSVFERWEGACSGVAPCVLNVDSDKLVTAVFRDLLP